MKFNAFLFLTLVPVFIGSCDPVGGPDPDPDCKADCEEDFPCPPGEPIPSCTKQKACKDGCVLKEDVDEQVSISRDALTHAASRVYSISSLYYQSGGCVHGAVASDSSSRCNSPIETLFARIPTDPCPPGTDPTLNVTVTEWQYNTTVDVRRVLRTVIDPPIGISSACADQYPGAKWDVTGAGESWTALGAKGIGTDVSTEKVSFTATSDGPTNLVKTIDLRLRDAQGNLIGGTLIDACAQSGECLFAFFASAHIWEAPGSFMLAMTCSSPPAQCGDGVLSGAETCDDGNVAAGDGCSATCMTESGWSCPAPGQTCMTTCGDGIKAGTEQCDDGNLISHDGCSSTCTSEFCSCQELLPGSRIQDKRQRISYEFK
jgi:cysteine-rich repeat protein